jgi:hypothetical protein
MQNQQEVDFEVYIYTKVQISINELVQSENAE